MNAIGAGDIVLRNWDESYPMKLGRVIEIIGNGLIDHALVNWFEWEVARLATQEGVDFMQSGMGDPDRSMRVYRRSDLVLYDKSEI